MSSYFVGILYQIQVGVSNYMAGAHICEYDKYIIDSVYNEDFNDDDV